MLRFTARFLGHFHSFFICLLSSGLMVALVSCNASKGLQITDAGPAYRQALQGCVGTATYNTKIDFYKRHFSGLLVFKAVSDTNKRAVFITETGFKLFDFEFTPSAINVLYCLAPMRKKVVLNIFKNDLGQLLWPPAGKPGYIFQKDSAITFTFARGNNKYEDYRIEGSGPQITGIARGGRYVKSVITRVKGIKNGNFDDIDIYHHPLKLHITLKQIER